MQLRCPEQVALVTLSGNHLTQPQLSAEAPFRAITEKSFAGVTHLTRPRSQDELNYHFIPPFILAWPVLVLREMQITSPGADTSTGNGFMNIQPCLVICSLHHKQETLCYPVSW